MSAPSLVVLAAGRGTRFGGPKQLVAVREDCATITDVLIERAGVAGIDHAVVVANEDVATEMGDGLRGRRLDAEVVCQRGQRGTAEALLAAREVVSGPIVVANADDLYPTTAFATAADHLAEKRREHAVVGFPVARTLHGDRPESRALLSDEGGRLTGVREGKVEPLPQFRFIAKGQDARSAVEPLHGDELVSMNLWALQHHVFDFLDAALAADGDGEVYLPDVVGEMIRAGEVVRLLRCDADCRGITYPEDVATLEPLL